MDAVDVAELYYRTPKCYIYKCAWGQ